MGALIEKQEEKALQKNEIYYDLGGDVAVEEDVEVFVPADVKMESESEEEGSRCEIEKKIGQEDSEGSSKKDDE